MSILDAVIGNVIQKELHCLDVIVINGIIKWIPLSSKDTSFGNEKSDVVFCTRVCPSLKQRSGNMKAARGHRNMERRHSILIYSVHIRIQLKKRQKACIVAMECTKMKESIGLECK